MCGDAGDRKNSDGATAIGKTRMPRRRWACKKQLVMYLCMPSTIMPHVHDARDPAPPLRLPRQMWKKKKKKKKWEDAYIHVSRYRSRRRTTKKIIRAAAAADRPGSEEVFVLPHFASQWHARTHIVHGASRQLQHVISSCAASSSGGDAQRMWTDRDRYVETAILGAIHGYIRQAVDTGGPLTKQLRSRVGGMRRVEYRCRTE